MLVLTRKTKETVVVGGLNGHDYPVRVTVLDVKGGKVRLGFEVPAEVPVHRLEVWERLARSEPNGDRGEIIARRLAL